MKAHLLAASVLLCAAACGGDGDPHPPGDAETPGGVATLHDASTPARTPRTAGADSEDELARSMLLTLVDFPRGWVHLPTDEDAYVQSVQREGPLAECHTTAFPGETGRAIGGEFSDEETTLLSINPWVFVFDSESSARAALDNIAENLRCFERLASDRLDIDETYAVANVSVEPLPIGDLGDARIAFRLTETQIYKDQNPPDSDVLVFDVVGVVLGRVVYEVDGFQREGPISRELLDTYLQKAATKIRQQP